MRGGPDQLIRRSAGRYTGGNDHDRHRAVALVCRQGTPVVRLRGPVVGDTDRRRAVSGRSGQGRARLHPGHRVGAHDGRRVAGAGGVRGQLCLRGAPAVPLPGDDRRRAASAGASAANVVRPVLHGLVPRLSVGRPDRGHRRVRGHADRRRRLPRSGGRPRRGGRRMCRPRPATDRGLPTGQPALPHPALDRRAHRTGSVDHVDGRVHERRRRPDGRIGVRADGPVHRRCTATRSRGEWADPRRGDGGDVHPRAGLARTGHGGAGS